MIRGRSTRVARAIAIAIALSIAGADARADDEDVPLPTGKPFVPARSRPDRASAPTKLCSFRERACVHAAPSIDPAFAMATLARAERSLFALRALGLPPPKGTIDLYVMPGAGEAETIADLPDPAGPVDRASAFVVLGPPPWRAECEADAAIARAVGEASIAGLDAGAEPALAIMTGSYLATWIAPCASVEALAIDDLQRSPERSLFLAGQGAMIVPWYLDDYYGSGAPGAVIMALASVASQRTPPGSWWFKNEPDLVDALRANAKQRGSTFDAMLLDLAIARAFMGSRSDGLHLDDAARFGEFGRVRFEWSVPFATLPRRLAPSRPIEPTGATYLWVDLTGVAKGATLTFVADWELPALFRWALVKVDRDGAEVGRVDVAGIFGSSHVERTVVGLDGLAGVIVAGVNAGSVDRGHPYDPDEEPIMPHGYTVTLAP